MAPVKGIEITGLDRLIATQPDAVLGPPLRTFFNAAARTVLAEISSRTPRRTGNLQRHLTAKVDPAPVPLWAEIGFQPLKYAPFVEYGTGLFGEAPGSAPHRIYPTHAKALAFTVGGSLVIRRSIAGMRPARMLRDGVAAAFPKVLALAAKIGEGITAQWQR